MKPRPFAAAARQISFACLIAMLYVLIILLNGTPALFFPVGLILYSVVIYGINHLFAKKTRTLAQLVVLNVICGAVVFLLFILTGCFAAFWQDVYGFFSLLILTIFAATAVYSPVKINSILLSMDANILLLLFSVLLIASLPHSFSWVFFAVFGAIAGLLGSLSCRMNRSLGRREWGVLLFLFAAIAVIAWLLFAFVVSPLSSGVADIGQSIAAFFVFLGSQIQRFFKFLASLMPEDDGTVEVDLQPASAGTGQEEVGRAADNHLMPVIVIGAIVLAVLVIVIVIIRKNRKTKIEGKKLAAIAQNEEARKSSLKEALQKVIKKVRRKLRARRYLATHKNGPEGLYFTLLNICRKTPFAKQAGDTPAEFLERIRTALPEDASAVQNLEELIRQLNRSFYAQTPVEGNFPWAADFLKTVRQQVHKVQ